jgi:hypothetical protein
LVTWFLDKKRWSVERLLATRLSLDEAMALMAEEAGPPPAKR